MRKILHKGHFLFVNGGGSLQHDLPAKKNKNIKVVLTCVLKMCIYYYGVTIALC